MDKQEIPCPKCKELGTLRQDESNLIRVICIGCGAKFRLVESEK